MCEIFSLISNSDFLNTFLGAVAGSGTIIFIDRREQQRKVLADVNTSIGVLGSLINTLVNIKKQHIVPMVLNYTENQDKVINMMLKKEPPSDNAINLHLHRFYMPHLEFEMPLDRVFTAFTHEYPQLVSILTQTKKTISEANSCFKNWDDLVERMSNMDEAKRLSLYFPYQTQYPDTIFPDMIKNFQMIIDDGLTFCDISCEALNHISKELLPLRLTNKVATAIIDDPEFKKYMPEAEHKKDWRHSWQKRKDQGVFKEKPNDANHL